VGTSKKIVLQCTHIWGLQGPAVQNTG
jgi:hypothetical protein